MLAPEERTTLVEQLRPPVDATLTNLVGTTFTLDLASALLPPLAVAHGVGPSSADPLAVLAALRTSVDVIDVFHQCGQVRIPKPPSRIYSLLEPALHAVEHRQGFLFHPKVWIARYEFDDGNAAFRLIVQSRNLTPDKSWDVALVLDGWEVSTPSKQNRPLVDLVKYLPTTSVLPVAEKRRERLATMAENLRFAEWDLPDGVSDLQFHVFGTGRHHVAPDFSGYRHLVVSPFITDGGLRRFDSNRVTVVSKSESLSSLSRSTLEAIDQPFVLAAAAGIPDDDGPSVGLLSGLHAKVYAVERGQRATFFTGSANATDAAFSGNVEILAELTGSKKLFGVDALMGEHGLGKLVDPFDIDLPPDVDDEDDRDIDECLRSIAAVKLTATVDYVDGTYSMHVTSDRTIDFPEGTTVSATLMTRPEFALDIAPNRKLDLVFDGVPLADITAFISIRSESESGSRAGTVVLAELVGEPAGRVNEIVASQVSTPADFLRLVALLLHFADPTAAADVGDATNGQTSRRALASGIFEQLVRAMATSPDSIEKLRGVVDSIVEAGDPAEVLPPGFIELWDAVCRSSDELGSTNAIQR